MTKFKLDLRKDQPDFRDQRYEPPMINLPVVRSLSVFKRRGIPILNQGREGSCAGHALATVANYLLKSQRGQEIKTSPRMLYELGKRYDQVDGEDYEGTTLRAVVKAWYKHGVCLEDTWPYRADREDRDFTEGRAKEAAKFPLGAYKRVDHRNLSHVHSAVTECGVLLAGAITHEGWTMPSKFSGVIRPGGEKGGGHAFVVVGYDAQGFYIQNSWGENWGMGGFGLITYADWLENTMDVWAVRLGVPVILDQS